MKLLLTIRSTHYIYCVLRRQCSVAECIMWLDVAISDASTRTIFCFIFLLLHVIQRNTGPNKIIGYVIVFCIGAWYEEFD